MWGLIDWSMGSVAYYSWYSCSFLSSSIYCSFSMGIWIFVLNPPSSEHFSNDHFQMEGLEKTSKMRFSLKKTISFSSFFGNDGYLGKKNTSHIHIHMLLLYFSHWFMQSTSFRLSKFVSFFGGFLGRRKRFS